MASGGSAWGSRSGFILASIGFAVGLGNIWRFPYVTGENGGSAFVLIYLLCAFGIGVPILMAEFLLGRRAQCSPPFAIAAVAQESGLSVRWSWVGNLTILTAFGILMSYAVVAGWVLYYF
jgi:NSS family neurotransmitter:Na+ symporter